MLIVMKFGGSSLSTQEKVKHAAEIIARKIEDGHKVVTVVSAQGKTTDELVLRGKLVTHFPPPRENDVLLSTGEQISMSIMAMQLHSMGYNAISLSGWQAGIKTNERYGNAMITEIDTKRILQELQDGKTVIVAGFQGIGPNDDITTLGRGGSDTTAIALASALQADACYIYTDVNGIYSANPRVVNGAKKHDDISFDDVLEMSSLGAKVMHNRSVCLAKNCGVPFEVRSSFSDEAGTLVHKLAPNRFVSGIACAADVSMITISGIDSGKSTCLLFSTLSDNDITVDVILRSQKYEDEFGTISFSVATSICDNVIKLIENSKIKYEHICVEGLLAKVSVIGSGLMDGCNIPSLILTELNKLDINPRYITTGEIRISVLIPAHMAQKAESALNSLFF